MSSHAVPSCPGQATILKPLWTIFSLPSPAPAPFSPAPAPAPSRSQFPSHAAATPACRYGAGCDSSSSPVSSRWSILTHSRRRSTAPAERRRRAERRRVGRSTAGACRSGHSMRQSHMPAEQNPRGTQSKKAHCAAECRPEGCRNHAHLHPLCLGPLLAAEGLTSPPPATRLEGHEFARLYKRLAGDARARHGVCTSPFFGTMSERAAATVRAEVQTKHPHTHAHRTQDTRTPHHKSLPV
jgi:hypothetical protein